MDDLVIRLLEGLRGPCAARAAARLRDIVEGLRMAERVRADEVLRRQLTSSYGWGVPNWLNSADDVRRLPLPAGTEGAVLGLIAAAPSGYVREAAIQRLALLGGGDEVAPLLIRAADWVAPVRSRGALVRLAGDAAVPALVAALGDGSASVSRVAADALRPRAARADAAALAMWFGGSNTAHVRRNALALLAVRGKWDGIAWILQACGDADPAVQAAGMQQLRRWHQRFNRSFTQPAPAQQERIRAALAQAGDTIDRKMATWLRFVAGIGG